MIPGTRKSGIDVIGDLPWGTHFGLFYKTKQDLIDFLVPYFEAGLKNNEFCMWVTAEPLNAGEAKACMAEALHDFDVYLDKGQIEIIPYTEWYTINGVFDGDRVLNGWVEKLRKAQERGFSGLRLTGNESWLEPGVWKDFIDYEQTINEVIGQYDMLGVCSYPLDKIDANEILDVVGTHQFVLTRRNGEWKIIEDQGQKKARKALQDSEGRYYSLFENMLDGFAYCKMIYDDNGNPVDFVYLDVNSAFKRLTGLENVVDKSVTEAIPGIRESHPELIEIYGRVATTGHPEKLELEFKPLSAWLSISVHSTEKGYFTAVFENITERKRAEESIRESEANLKKAEKIASMGHWQLDLRTYEVHWSDNIYILLGYFVHGCVPEWESWSTRIHPDDRELAEQRLKDAISNDELYDNDYRVVLPDGSIRYMHDLTDRLIRDDKGNPVMIFGTMQDITERKQAEYSLMKSEANLAKSQEMAHIGSWEMDVETGTIDRSEESYRIFGFVPGDVNLNYRKFLECIVPEDRERVDNVIKLSMKTGQPYDIIYNIKRRDGESRILFSHGEAIKDASGHIIKIFGTNHDITEQKRAEERLRNSEARFRSYFELPIIGIGITSVDKKWIQINDKLCEILGYSREELLHSTWVEITHPDDILKNIELFNKVISGEIDGYTLDKRFIRKNGDIVYIINSVSCVRCIDGTVDYFVTTVQDISDRDRIEKELMDSKSQAELYVDLMGHDINNMNQVGMGYLELALDMLSLDENGQSLLSKPMSAFENSTRLIDNVRKLQRVKSGELLNTEMDIGQVLSEVQYQYSRLHGRNVSINYVPVIGYAVRANELLYDLFSNLVGNAIKHSNGHPVININVKSVHENRMDYYTVSIEDNGPGIPDDLKPIIFNRRLRGGSKAKGSGIGLFLVKTLVDDYGGRVWVEDRVLDDYTKGSRFVVMLPVAEQ